MFELTLALVNDGPKLIIVINVKGNKICAPFDL